jgi:hypothetical protein
MSTKSGAAVSGTKILAAAAAASAIRYKQDDLAYDLGLLAASDHHPVDPVAYQKDAEAALLKTATENTQLLVKQIFELPVQIEEVGPVAMLPDRTTKLPRAKPVPKPKPLTRWEKFAQTKGITKTKRSRNVWDDEKKEWAPRYGYKRANDSSSDWAMEVRDGAPDSEDPFERAALEKSHRVVKNQINHVRNLQRATKASDKSTGMGDEIATADAGKAKKLVLDGYSAAGSSGGALVAPRIREKSVDVAPKSKRARHDDDEHGAVAGKKKVSKKELKAARSAPIVHTTASGERLVVPVGVPQIAVAEGAMKGSEHKGRQKQSEGKHTKTERLKVVQRSTASLGKVRNPFGKTKQNNNAILLALFHCSLTLVLRGNLKSQRIHAR